MSKRKQPVGCSKHDIDSYIGCVGCDEAQARWKAEQAPVGNDLDSKLAALVEKYEDWNAAADIERDLRAAMTAALEHAAEIAESTVAHMDIGFDAWQRVAPSIRAAARALGSRT